MSRFLVVLVGVLTLCSPMLAGSHAARSTGDAGKDKTANLPGNQILPCQICAPVIRCWTCLSAGASGGGPICTYTCDSCHVMGICGTGGHPGFGDDDDDDEGAVPAAGQSLLSDRRLAVNAATVFAVAAKYPRMAILLAKINREGGFRNLPSRLYMTPIQLTQDDLDQSLAPGYLSPEYEKQLRDRSGDLNEAIAKGQASAVIYDIRPRAFGSDRPVIRIRVIQRAPSDPAYSGLILKFSQPAAASEDKAVTPVWKVDWQLVD